MTRPSEQSCREAAAPPSRPSLYSSVLHTKQTNPIRIQTEHVFYSKTFRQRKTMVDSRPCAKTRKLSLVSFVFFVAVLCNYLKHARLITVSASQSKCFNIHLKSPTLACCGSLLPSKKSPLVDELKKSIDLQFCSLQRVKQYKD